MSWTAQVASSVDVAQILAAAGMGGTAAQTAQALFLPAAGPLDVIAELPEGALDLADLTVTVVLQREGYERLLPRVAPQ